MNIPLKEPNDAFKRNWLVEPCDLSRFELFDLSHTDICVGRLVGDLVLEGGHVRAATVVRVEARRPTPVVQIGKLAPPGPVCGSFAGGAAAATSSSARKISNFLGISDMLPTVSLRLAAIVVGAVPIHGYLVS